MCMYPEFPEWYKEANIPATKDLLNLRWQGIEKAVDICDKDMICSLVAFCYGLQMPDHSKQQFAAMFTEFDEKFSYKQEKELALLAGVTLVYLVKTKYTYDSMIETLVLVAQGYRKAIIPCSVEAEIIQQFDRDRISLRVDFPNDLLDDLKNLHDNFSDNSWSASVGKKILSPFIEILEKQNRNISILREDSQILWWMTANWSNYLKRRLKSCDKKAMGLILGGEAASFIHNYPGPYSIEAVLEEQISKCKGENIQLTLQEIIQNTDSSWKLALQTCESIPAGLLPIHSAIAYAQKAGDGVDWFSEYQQDVLGKASYPKCRPGQFAWYFYLEEIAEACYQSIDT